MSKTLLVSLKRLSLVSLMSFFLSGCWVYYGVYTAPVFVRTCVPGWVTVPVHTFHGVFFQNVYSNCAWVMSLNQTPDIDRDSRQLALGGMPLDGAREFLEILSEMDRELRRQRDPSRPFQKRDLELSAQFLLHPEAAEGDFSAAVEELARHLDYELERTQELVEHFRDYVHKQLLTPEAKPDSFAL